MSRTLLERAVHTSLKQYFQALGNVPPHGELYELVISHVERPLIEDVLRRCAGNQSQAATWLGLSRNTLRKKMTTLGMTS